MFHKKSVIKIVTVVQLLKGSWGLLILEIGHISHDRDPGPPPIDSREQQLPSPAMDLLPATCDYPKIRLDQTHTCVLRR